jgi:hypothetical protein
MYFHYQNLKKYDRKDKNLVHGRLWWKKDSHPSDGLHAEWVIGSKTFNLGFNISKNYVSEYTMHFDFCIPPISLYWDFIWTWLENREWWQKIVREDNNKIIRTLPNDIVITKQAEERRFGIIIFDWTIWWDIYNKPHESSSKDPKWMHGGFNILDFLFGSIKIDSQIISERNIKIPMPEKTYDAVVKMEEITHKRSRWPFIKRFTRADINCEEGIKHPGKGTCDYNCGEDATYGLSCMADNPEEAIGKFVASVLHMRRVYPL